MRSLSASLTVLLFLAALILLPSKAAAAEQKLKLATLAPKGTTYYQVLMRMGQEWKQAPAGGAKLTIYPDGMMGGEGDVIRRMRVGQIDVCLMTAPGLSQIDDSINALQNMPLVYRSYEEIDYVRTKMLPLIEKRFADKGYILLSLDHAGWVKFFSRQAFSTPEEMKRLRIFTAASDTNTLELWKAAGYNPVPLDTPDMLTGLRTSLVDVVPAPPEYALAGQFYSAAPHMLDLEWAPLFGGLVMTKSAWDKFRPQTQAALREAAVKAGVEIRAISAEKAAEAIAAMRERGLSTHPLAPAEFEQWEKAKDDLLPLIRGRIVPADLFDQVQQHLNEFRKSQAG